MGNVMSRCANEITTVFRNCRSRKSEDERKQKRNVEPRSDCDTDRHQQRHHQAEAGFEEIDIAAPEHSELLAYLSKARADDCLPECDQTPDSHRPNPVVAGRYRTDSGDVIQEPRISKEFMIQTYRISKPNCPATSSVTNECAKDDTGSETQRKDSTQDKFEEVQPKTADDTNTNSNTESPSCAALKVKPKRVENIASESCAVQREWTAEVTATGSRGTMQPNLTNYLIKRTHLQPTIKFQPKAVSDVNRNQRTALEPSAEKLKAGSAQVHQIQSTETSAVERSGNLMKAKTDMGRKSGVVTLAKPEREANTMKHFLEQREPSTVEANSNTSKHNLDQQRKAMGVGDKEEQVWKGRIRAGNSDANCPDTVTEQVRCTV